MAKERLEIPIEITKDATALRDLIGDLRSLAKTSERMADDIRRQTRSIDDGFRNISRSISNARRLMLGLIGAAGMVALTYQLKKLASSAIQVAANFERMKISLDTITRGRGEEWFRKLNEWALKMPVNTERAIQVFTMLRAMGLKPTIEDMTTLVDTTSALGGGADTLDGIGRALGQIATKGKVSAEELMQLAERGVPAYEILAEKLGLSADQVANIGKYAIDGEKAVRALLEGMAERFGGQSARMQSTWAGLMETLRSYWVEFQRAVMESGIFKVLRERVKALVDFIDEARKTGKWAQWVDTVSTSILKALAGITEFGKGSIQIVTIAAQTVVGIVEGIKWTFLGLLRLISGAMAMIKKVPREIAIAMAPMAPGLWAMRELAGSIDWKAIGENARKGMKDAVAAIDTTNSAIEKMGLKLTEIADRLKAELQAVLGAKKDANKELARNEADLTEVTAAEERKRVLAARRAAQSTLAEVEKQLKKEMTLYERHYQKLRQIHEGMRTDAERTEEMIRNLERQGMTEAQAWWDRRREAEEKIRQAREAYLTGDLEAARRLAKAAQEVARSLAREVKTEEGETVIEKAYGINKAKDLIREAGRIIKDAWEEQKAEAEDALAAQEEKLAPLKDRWEELKAKVEEYSKELKKLTVPTTAPIRIETNYEEIKRQFEELQKPRETTLTIHVRRVEGAQAGGVIGKFARGGWARIQGVLGGYGGGDKIRALLEAGEYVVRKEAVRRYGLAMLEAINSLRFPAPSIPIPAFSAGGPVEGAPLLGRIEVALPGGESVELLSTTQEARKLERILSRVRKIT